MEKYCITAAEIGERTPCDPASVCIASTGGSVSDDMLSAMEAALFALTINRIPAAVYLTWRSRCASLGLGLYGFVKRAGIPISIADRVGQYERGERRPFKSTIMQFETALRKMETEAKQVRY